MKRLSVRWKLTMWYAGVLTLVLIVFSSSVYVVISHQMLGRVDQGLEEELADVLFEIQRAQRKDDMLMWLDRRFARHEGFDFQITNAEGVRVFVNERLLKKSLPAPRVLADRGTFDTVVLEGARYRMISTKTTGPNVGAFDVQMTMTTIATRWRSANTQGSVASGRIRAAGHRVRPCLSLAECVHR